MRLKHWFRFKQSAAEEKKPKRTINLCSSLKLHLDFHPNKKQCKCSIANVFLTKNLLDAFQVYVTVIHKRTRLLSNSEQNPIE